MFATGRNFLPNGRFWRNADNSASEPKRILTCGPIFLAAYRGLDLVRAIARQRRTDSSGE